MANRRFPDFDPMRSFRQMEKLTAKAMDPLAESRRLLDSMNSPAFVDPLAKSRSLMEALEPKPTFDPMAESRRIKEAWQNEASFDPYGKYQEMVDRFSRVHRDPGVERPAVENTTETISNPSIPGALSNQQLIVALVGIAWTCLWMISRGADVSTYGDLFIEAVGLALIFAEKR